MKQLQIPFLFVILNTVFLGCNSSNKNTTFKKSEQYLTVLGVAQDAGYPQIGCQEACCSAYFNNEETKKLVSSLGLVDMEANKKWLFDATPDMSEQLRNLEVDHLKNEQLIDGVFLTHAHIGHYTGVMQLGREAYGAKEIPVYVMPKMKRFLEENGPWSQLVDLKNVTLKALKDDSLMVLTQKLKVVPFIVPHREEYSETVGYKIVGQKKSALFIPDIDKWHLWGKDIIEEVKKVDYAFLDATFFRNGELERDMSQIPHPFITETTTLFENESIQTKNKIFFIHFNHTNPGIKKSHRLKDSITDLGFNFAKEGQNFGL